MPRHLWGFLRQPPPSPFVLLYPLIGKLSYPILPNPIDLPSRTPISRLPGANLLSTRAFWVKIAQASPLHALRHTVTMSMWAALALGKDKTGTGSEPGLRWDCLGDRNGEVPAPVLFRIADSR